MIAEIGRGNDMPGLVRYLFGPGRANEHLNQHLVAGHADLDLSAPPRLWESEPGVQRRVSREARELGGEVEFPRFRWNAEVPRGYVWHCSLAVSADEGQLTDDQWAEAARALVDAVGFSGADGKAPCRWIAVRHGLSAAGNDHIHIAVNLVREDGTKASTWNDYRKAGAACTGLEERFGLRHVPGRAAGRHLPEPSRADREISAARGEPEPLRTRLERTVRACAAAARAEADFITLARSAGLLVRPRYARDDPARVTGYAVADPHGRQARHRTGTTGPVWFGGGKLAGDLSLPGLRARWQPDPAQTTAEALAAWDCPDGTAPGTTRPPVLARTGQAPADGPVTAAELAGLLAAAAAGLGAGNPGPLSRAARSMARAAQAPPATVPAPASQAEALRLVRDIYHLVAGPQPAPAAPARTSPGRDPVQRARELAAARDVRAAYGIDPPVTEMLRGIAAEYLAVAAIGRRQGGTLRAAGLLAKLTATCAVAAVTPVSQDDARRAAELTAAYAATATAPHPQPSGTGPTGAVASDAALRALLPAASWERDAADPRRAALRELLDRAAAQGRDPAALLAAAVASRPLDDPAAAPARSIAAVLHHRVTAALTAQRRPAAIDGLPSLAVASVAAGIAPYRPPSASSRREDPAARTQAERQRDQRHQDRQGGRGSR